jgi:hypothetical protein
MAADGTEYVWITLNDISAGALALGDIVRRLVHPTFAGPS